jgi:hypothetical protein
MVGQLNFWLFNEGNAVTFHTAEALNTGFVKIDAPYRVRNTIAGEEPDGVVANTYISGAENVTVYASNGVARLTFDAAGTAGQKVTTGNAGSARGVNGYTSGQCYGVLINDAVSGLTGKVWLRGIK